MTARRTPPFAFFFLNASLGWPVGVIGLALTNVLVRSGFTVGQAASIWAAGALPFTLQFLLGPIVDSSATRRGWFVGGTLFMAVCLAGLLVAPWKTTPVAALAALAFCSCLGAALCAAATKGMIAYHVPPERLGAASGWYISHDARPLLRWGEFIGQARKIGGGLIRVRHDDRSRMFTQRFRRE